MTPEAPTPRPPRWPWLLLALALAWSVLVRVPFNRNAAAWLDSDLAVEGLTLDEAVHGHWRWHYPSATYMGIPPLLLSVPPALAWGANPWTLAVGGTVAYLGVIAATFVLVWRAFGPRVASWSLVPLAFASTGTIWLSGRVYAGHLVAAAWHAAAFALLCGCLTRGGWLRAAALGLWCGLGIYVDKMLGITVAAIAPAAALAWFGSGRSTRALGCVPAFALGLVLGYLPHAIGARVDPFDNYNDQFSSILDRDVLLEHTRLLVLECLPRLIAGHRLPGLQPEDKLAPGMRLIERGAGPSGDPLAWATTLLSLGLFAASLASLALGPRPPAGPAGQATRRGLLLATAAVAAGFILNRNIFDSDNYRYLVYLLAPWALGFGLLMDRLTRRSRGAAVAAGLLAAALAGTMTLDTAHYCRRFGWITPAWQPAQAELRDPALAWLGEHPEVTHLFGDYWDVYRLSFLTGGRVKGSPYPGYPDRFPEWSRDLPGKRPAWIIARTNTPKGYETVQAATRAGGRELFRAGNLAIVSWPTEEARPRDRSRSGR